MNFRFAGLSEESGESGGYERDMQEDHEYERAMWEGEGCGEAGWLRFGVGPVSQWKRWVDQVGEGCEEEGHGSERRRDLTPRRAQYLCHLRRKSSDDPARTR